MITQWELTRLAVVGQFDPFVGFSVLLCLHYNTKQNSSASYSTRKGTPKGELGKIVQNALCEKLRILPRGKPIAGTRAMGSFCEVAREAKGRTQRRKADILVREKWELEEGRV